MKYLKRIGFAAIVAFALMAFMVAGTASATTFTGSGGTTLPAGTTVHEEVEETDSWFLPFGSPKCKKTTRHWKTENSGGSTETIAGPVDTLTFGECEAEVVVLKSGSLQIHTKETSANNNGTITSSGAEVTITFAGFHCIYTTSNTDLGTLTGSATTGGNATTDISATVPRTGGRSGAFCGTSAGLTGSTKITSPSVLNVD